MKSTQPVILRLEAGECTLGVALPQLIFLTPRTQRTQRNRNESFLSSRCDLGGLCVRQFGFMGRLAKQGFPWLLLALCSLLLAPCLKATEPTDLGQGLAYLRVHSVTESEADLRQALPGTGALVLDLRYATADRDAATFLQAALAERPARAPLFILVSPATPKTLGRVVAASTALTLGAPGSTPAPKVVVQTDAAADRRAYDALETGTALEKLISGKIEKERFDEASLMDEFKNGHAEPAPPPLSDPAAPKSADTPKQADTPEKEPPPAPPTDRVLQRAVHLHQALQVLKSR
jgi:hypothetical protein